MAAHATPISVGTWYEFSFPGPGSALGSRVGTPLGTNAPDGHPILQVGDAPWTITSPGAQLLMLDGFLSVDQFEIFDNLASIGTTSAPTPGADCFSDIACALNDPSYSRGTFDLGIGDHSFTGNQILGEAGAGFFQITEAAQVPEPATLSVFGLALFGLLAFWRRERSARA